VSPRHLLPGTMILAAMCAAAWGGAPQTSGQSKTQPATAKPAATHQAQPEEEGERIFDQNCSRCHTAPEGFSSRISGTVIRHMRVRASLSQHDEQVLLHYLNP
jgi:mono/diheme cytochrome c family protein